MSCINRRKIDMHIIRRPFATPLAAAALASSPSAWAHSGHGLGDAAHWHATDAWGWALALAVGAAALLLGRRK